MYITSKSGRRVYMPSDEEDAEINVGIGADLDTYELTDSEFKQLQPAGVGRPKMENPKTPVSIRLSPEVVDYFKGTGKGWQTRVNEVLKDYVAHQ